VDIKMNVGEILIVVFLSYYSFFFFSLLKSKTRKDMQTANIKMDELRSVPVKTLEEQKAFLDIKYPKNKFKFKKEMIYQVLISMGCFIVLFQFYKLQLLSLGWNIRAWHGILFVIITPIIMNMILKKFNLQKSDISVFFR